MPEARRAAFLRQKADPVWFAAYQEKEKKRRREKYLRDPEYFHAKTRAWEARNPEKAKAAQLKTEAKRDKVKKRATTRAWFKKKYESDPVFRSQVYMRNRIRDLVRGIVSTASCMEMIGCEPEVFRDHIARQFKPGMTWANYGYETWHIDHIRPLATFSMLDAEDRRRAFHYTNLQPLWREENQRKGKFQIPDEYIGEQLGLPMLS